ncbi:ABC transporter permease [Amycolatopsis sp. FDAARGOS 1241]|uniref:ABC transporter permease n=1 Tax=Amycolatopsis sp. FDAARGOS 1241 TaxID=2778070 RepID=UPI0019516989|nr:ABC transporter permease [Amycolatopsis sp. FDAARGOS 1241]QRP42611.1 ABC transporter permease [Amycolatopsis sp. FDAARGOS 1241]
MTVLAVAVPAQRRTGVLHSARARVALGVIVVLGLAGAFAGLLSPEDPRAQTAQLLTGPSGAHWLGTDELGRDLLSRVLHGIQVDLVVGVAGVAVAGLLGVLAAVLSARWAAADVVAQRVIDVLLAFPSLILAVAVAAVLGTGMVSITVAIVLSQAPICCRVVRAGLLAQRDRDYAVAARLSGVGPWRVLLRHLLPTALDALVVQLVLSLSTAVFLEGGMSFVGIGVRPPDPSLGNILQESVQYLTVRPSFVVGPLVAITALVLGFTVLGDALNNAARQGGSQT